MIHKSLGPSLLPEALLLVSLGSWSSALKAETGDERESMTVIAPNASISGHLGLSQLVITREEIEKAHTPYLADLLATVPGISVVRAGGRGGTTSLFIRGSKSSQFILSIDGIPQRDPTLNEGGSELSQLTTAGIERIEIFKGPQSLVYGSNGIAGVINIVRRRTSGATLGLEAGSLGYREASVYGRGALGEHAHLIVDAEALAETGASDADVENGNREKDGSTLQNAGLQLGYAQAAWTATLALRQSRSSKELDSFGPQGFADDPNYKAKGQARTLSGELARGFDWGALSLRWERQKTLRAYRNAADDLRPDVSHSDYEGQQDFLELKAVSQVGAHTLSIGTQLTKEKASFDENFGGMGSLLKKDGDATALFLTESWQASDLNLKAGVRRDHFEAFGDQDTFNLFASYELGPLSPYANVGRAFKAPSLYQLYGAYGREDLEAERSLGYEIGAKSRWEGPFQLEVSGFENRASDLIEYSMVSQSYANIPGATRIRGVESRWNYAYGTQNFELNSSHMTFKTADGKDSLDRRPKQTYGLTYSLALNPWRFGLQAERIGERYDSGTRLAPYQVLNGQCERVFGQLKAYARVDNLLASSYQEIAGYSRPTRRYVGGLKWTL